MKKLLTVSLSVLLLGIFTGAAAKRTPEARNIILMIGDGMGLSELSSAYYFQDKEPSFSRFHHISLIRTSSASHKVTDSAAAATALACGVKTFNGALGVTPDGKAAEDICEIAARKGRKTGLISTAPITHATPAGFYAHIRKRGEMDSIAVQLLASPIDFFAGGGLNNFCRRADGQNLLDRQTTFRIDTTALPVSGKSLDATQRYGYLLAGDGMPTMLQGRGDFLSQAVQVAVDYLSKSRKGFFLMVEGGQIDWGGHENDADYLIAETLDFDKAIDRAMDFAEKDGHTLVIVLADHETGGFSLTAARNGKGAYDYHEIGPTFTATCHSATLIPVFAYGPGASIFNGVYQNSDVFPKMLQAFHLK